MDDTKVTASDARSQSRFAVGYAHERATIGRFPFL